MSPIYVGPVYLTAHSKGTFRIRMDIRKLLIPEDQSQKATRGLAPSKPIRTGSSSPDFAYPEPSGPPSSLVQRAVESDTSSFLPGNSPAKKNTKWTAEDDKLLTTLRNNRTTWDEIAKAFPGRSSLSCRLHYQNYVEKQVDWDEERKSKLARLYVRYVHYQMPRHSMTLLHTNVRTGPFCYTCL